MVIPATITLFNTLTISTLYLFSAFGVVMWSFVIWYEGQKDGFNTDKTFDIGFWVISAFTLVYVSLNSYFFKLEIFDPQNWLLHYDKQLTLIIIPFISTLIPIVVLTRKWKWSIYRVLDILTHANIAFAVVYLLGYLLVYGDKQLIVPLGVLVGLQFLILKYRGHNVASGLIFSGVLILTAVVGFMFIRRPGYLLFYTLLITISLVVLYFRGKKTMIFNTNIPNELLKALQAKLTAKDKQLKSEQQQLSAEDAFMNQDRTMDNAEEIDEAILEDNQKELTDVKLDAIRLMRLQVRKALGFMKLGKYGICESCGQPIDKARLRAYPEATKCFECANKENH